MNPDLSSNHPETRFRQPHGQGLGRAKSRRITVPKPAVKQPNLMAAPLSIGATIFGAQTQDIEKDGIYPSDRAEGAQALKSLATFACRAGGKRIQPAASGKWGEVPIFDISRIEMTNV